MVKLDFPHFNGLEDLTRRSCELNQIFKRHQTPQEEKIPLALFNLEGDAQWSII
jgi:hypothetical protein